ncbi:uncharacterized protein LOC129755912 [Uranotaenia lowii]|uniref:uncharacterized protein LOC129755912 n=1 Tax=Uranotaenia lowii TaxID=190385 RepID=UPI00247AE964|nr:uncharacterized protein LOC129755912 [Uranotaenia lowii]XP_055608592.1 uncharacterized protein LOC129755912 [Uranotaenia lowii]
MVISATNKMFLLTFVLFVLCVALFFVLVTIRKNEKNAQWEQFVRRGQHRFTATGTTNHWYFVIRDIDKIKSLSQVRNLEKANRIEPTEGGFVLHGSDYEIAFDRVSPHRRSSIDARAKLSMVTSSSSSSPSGSSIIGNMEEDYILSLVKRKLYPWDVKSKTNDDKG